VEVEIKENDAEPNIFPSIFNNQPAEKTEVENLKTKNSDPEK